MNNKLFWKKLRELDYKSVLDLSKRRKIHRNTIQNYLSGKDPFANAFISICHALDINPTDLISPISTTEAKLENISEILPIAADIAKSSDDIAVILIGSRAKRTNKKYSDWDIGVTGGKNSIRGIDYLKLKGRVEELADDLPRNVQLINLDDAPAWFLREIDYLPIFLDGNNESFQYFMGVLNGVKRKAA